MVLQDVFVSIQKQLRHDLKSPAGDLHSSRWPRGLGGRCGARAGPAPRSRAPRCTSCPRRARSPRRGRTPEALGMAYRAARETRADGGWCRQVPQGSKGQDPPRVGASLHNLPTPVAARVAPRVLPRGRTSCARGAASARWPWRRPTPAGTGPRAGEGLALPRLCGRAVHAPPQNIPKHRTTPRSAPEYTTPQDNTKWEDCETSTIPQFGCGWVCLCAAKKLLGARKATPSRHPPSTRTHHPL